MHIIIESQTSDARSVLCIDRNSNHAEIIEADPEHMDQLTSIARALGVDELRMVLRKGVDLPGPDWKVLQALVVVYEL